MSETNHSKYHKKEILTRICSQFLANIYFSVRHAQG